MTELLVPSISGWSAMMRQRHPSGWEKVRYLSVTQAFAQCYPDAWPLIRKMSPTAAVAHVWDLEPVGER